MGRDAAQAIIVRYHEVNSGAVLTVFLCAYIFMQSFAIPGSVIFSLLSGPLFGPITGWCIVCFSTTSGAITCYLVSNCFMRRLLVHHFPSRVYFLEQKVKENSDNMFYFMLSLRMSPLLPNWFVNAASPVAGVSLRIFALATLIGLMPINFLHVQAGARGAQPKRRAAVPLQPQRLPLLPTGMTLGYAESLSSALQNYQRVLLLLALSVLALVPVYVKSRRRRKTGQAYHAVKEKDDGDGDVEHGGTRLQSARSGTMSL